jgi:hypothetical protein
MPLLHCKVYWKESQFFIYFYTELQAPWSYFPVPCVPGWFVLIGWCITWMSRPPQVRMIRSLFFLICSQRPWFSGTFPLFFLNCFYILCSTSCLSRSRIRNIPNRSRLSRRPWEQELLHALNRHKVTFDTSCVKYDSQLSAIITWGVFGTPCVKKCWGIFDTCKAKYASHVTYAQFLSGYT